MESVQNQNLQGRLRPRRRVNPDASPRSANAATLHMGHHGAMVTDGQATATSGSGSISIANGGSTNNNLLLGMTTMNSSNSKMDNDGSLHHHNGSISSIGAPDSPKDKDRRLTSGSRWFQFQHWRRRNTPLSVRTTSRSSTSTVRKTSCWEASGLNFIIPALSIWLLIVTVFFWGEMKDSALDYYYLQYPERQPESPIPGTILPLLPTVWIYQPPVVDAELEDAVKQEEDAERRLEQLQQQHHQQPHYYMLPQNYFDQQHASSYNFTKPPLEIYSKIRGVLIILHACHQTGLHVFQLPESRIMVAQALQRGLAVLAPTSSSAAVVHAQQAGAVGAPKNVQCWNVGLDKPMLGNMLYQWAHEQELSSLPRMAVGVSSGANLLISGSLYKTLRLSSMALYASHHPEGFHAEDLEQDVVPPTAFLVFPRNQQATEYAEQHYHTLKRQLTPPETDNIEEEGDGSNRKQLVDEEAEEEEDEISQDVEPLKKKLPSFAPTQLWRVQPHPWTVELCQERLPEFHFRCRGFFRHVQKHQQRQQLRHAQSYLQFSAESPKKKKLKWGQRAGKSNSAVKLLMSPEGEVLQSSKSPHWIPIMEELGLDDWKTHMMAFSNVARPKRRKSPDQQLSSPEMQQHQPQRSPPFQVQFPTAATPEGRSWLWASMLQEIEVAYGLSQMTVEHSVPILMFLMHHAGVAQQSAEFSTSNQ